MTTDNQQKAVKEISSQDWESEVLKHQGPVLVDFWAPWCGPCRVLSPTIEDIAREQKFDLKVVKVNVDQNQTIAIAYNIQSIPTVAIFKNGQILATTIGAQSKSSIEKFIANTISKI